MIARQFELVLPRQMPGERLPAVTRGDWKHTAPLTIAVGVVHPQGGFTVALPLSDPKSSAREYHGRYDSMQQARDAAREYNLDNNLSHQN